MDWITPADYMNGMPPFDNAGLLPALRTLGYLENNIQSFSPPSPATPLSASFSPQPEFDPYMSSSSKYVSVSPTPSPNQWDVANNLNRSNDNICPYSDCTSKGKFKRRTDLNRHIRTQHEAENHMMDCKHGWCGRTGSNGFSREDHLREHRREVHREAIPFKTTKRSSEGGASSSSSSRKEPKRKYTTSEPRAIPQSYSSFQSYYGRCDWCGSSGTTLRNREVLRYAYGRDLWIYDVYEIVVFYCLMSLCYSFHILLLFPSSIMYS